MVKKVLLSIGALLAGLWVIGKFIDPPRPPPPPAPTPAMLYRANPAPRIPDPTPEEARPPPRRQTAEQQRARLHATVRRHGTPGATNWRDAAKALVWSSFAVRHCPALTISREAYDDIQAAWDIDFASETGQRTELGLGADALLEVRRNRQEFCRTAWQAYGYNGAIATILRRSD